MSEPEAQDVIFRVWREHPHSVMALFPLGDHAGRCNWLESGQEACCLDDYRELLRLTRAASSEEAAPLRAELEGLGYRLCVRQRARRL